MTDIVILLTILCISLIVGPLILLELMYGKSNSNVDKCDYCNEYKCQKTICKYLYCKYD